MPPLKWLLTPPLWHLDAVGGRPIHHRHFAEREWRHCGRGALQAWSRKLVKPAGRLCAELRHRAAVDRLLVHGPVRHEHGLDAGSEIERYGFDDRLLPGSGADRLRNWARG